MQGCFAELQRLLDRLQFDPQHDQLWFVGDIVNRGPESLKTLRFVKDLGDAAITVLGNHDLHLLAIAAGQARNKGKDTLTPILDAADRDELLHWLRHRPLLHYDATHNISMLHAGLPPQWSARRARKLAAEVEQALQNDAEQYFANMYGDEPARWDKKLQGPARLRFITNCLTRLRYCSLDGTLELRCKSQPGTQPAGILPWFQVPGRASAEDALIFGHWSTLGAHRFGKVHALDSGCLWGGCLTALQVDGERNFTQVDCPGALQPG